MGVVGIILEYTDLVEIFHVDFEEYGIDGYYSISKKNQEKINKKKKLAIDGLGGELIEITLIEAKHLLSQAEQVRVNPFDLRADLFVELLEPEILETVYNKITVAYENIYERINYFLMRLIGKDQMSLEFFSYDGSISLVQVPSTLLKNTITYEKDDVYQCRSIIESEGNYELLILEIHFKMDKIDKLKILKRMTLSNTEAAFNLNKKEHILVYNVAEGYEEDFYKETSVLKTGYSQGNLYTQYQSDNTHVRKKIYWLNDDVYAVYYFTHSGQLVVASFDPDVLETLQKTFHSEKKLYFIGKLVSDHSIIYSFIDSSYQDFYEFLN